MTVWWNVVQICIWIATRDEHLVERFKASSLSAADHHVNLEIQPPPSLTVFEASKILADACSLCLGSLYLYGRPCGTGDPQAIMPMAWSIHLQFVDDNTIGVVLRPPVTSTGATWWSDLCAYSAVVQNLWPPIQHATASPTDAGTHSEPAPAASAPHAIPAPPRHAGRKLSPERIQAAAYLNRRYPTGVPSTRSLDALVAELKHEGIVVSRRTVSRVLGRR
jgi:hypothetical protein